MSIFDRINVGKAFELLESLDLLGIQIPDLVPDWKGATPTSYAELDTGVEAVTEGIVAALGADGRLDFPRDLLPLGWAIARGVPFASGLLALPPCPMTPQGIVLPHEEWADFPGLTMWGAANYTVQTFCNNFDPEVDFHLSWYLRWAENAVEEATDTAIVEGIRFTAPLAIELGVREWKRRQDVEA